MGRGRGWWRRQPLEHWATAGGRRGERWGWEWDGGAGEVRQSTEGNVAAETVSRKKKLFPLPPRLDWFGFGESSLSSRRFCSPQPKPRMNPPRKLEILFATTTDTPRMNPPHKVDPRPSPPNISNCAHLDSLLTWRWSLPRRKLSAMVPGDDNDEAVHAGAMGSAVLLTPSTSMQSLLDD